MATNLTNIPVDEIRALVDERGRYEGWIGALESRRGQTPPHVYERVHGDYDGRLTRVMDRLGTYVTALRDGESTLAGREDELDRAIAERRDELAEIELRTAVGEYAAEEGERLRTTKEGEVQDLEEDQTQVRADLGTVRELLGRSLPPGEEHTVAAPPRAATPARPTAVAEAAPAAPAADEERGGAEALGSAEEPWPERGEEEPAGAAAPAATSATATAERREPEGWSAPGATAAAAEGVGRSAVPPATFPAAGMPDQEKTLRCPDCGAMNYPTEWYCEKCGGELAAL